MTDETDREARVRALLPEINLVTDPRLAASVAQIWTRAWASGVWDDLAQVPKSPQLPSRRTLVTHSRAVARLSAQMADIQTELNGLEVSRDRTVAIALLHDVSKIAEFEPTEDGARLSRTGARLQHGFLGAAWMLEAGLDEDLVHAVLCHTPQSATVPQTQEAVIVHYADFADTDALLLSEGQTLFCKRRG